MINFTAEEINDAIAQSQLKITRFSDSLEMRRIWKRVSQELAANGWEPCLGSVVATKLYASEEQPLAAFVVDRGESGLVLGVFHHRWLRISQELEVPIPKIDDASEIRRQVSKFVFKVEQRIADMRGWNSSHRLTMFLHSRVKQGAGASLKDQ